MPRMLRGMDPPNIIVDLFISIPTIELRLASQWQRPKFCNLSDKYVSLEGCGIQPC